MQKSKELHELIRSMTRSEKRFFKIYCSRHQIGEKNNYVLLFDVFDSMKTFDASKLKIKISNADFIKNFAAEQNYLYNNVLECLDIYHKGSSVEKQITRLTNIGRVLANKKLEEQSVKILEKARQLAESHFRFASLIPIYELQKRKHISQDTITSPLLEEHYTKMEHAITRLSSSLRYKRIFDELLILRRKVGYVINDTILEQVKAIFPEANKPDPTSFSSFDEEVACYLCKMEYYRLVHQNDLGNTYPEKLIQLFEGNVKFLTGDYIEHYIYALNVFIVSRMYKNESEARKTLHKVKNLGKIISKKDNTIYVKAKVFEVYYTCITDLAINSKKYDEVLDQLDEIERHFAKFENHMTPTFSLVLKSNLACIAFNTGQLDIALKWCHEVINEAPKLREDAYYIMRILYLMIHYELKNEQILPSLMHSISRYLTKQNRVSKFETILLKHLKALLNVPSKKEKRVLFESMKTAITPLQNDPYERLALNEIDVFGWLEKNIVV